MNLFSEEVVPIETKSVALVLTVNDPAMLTFLVNDKEIVIPATYLAKGSVLTVLFRPVGKAKEDG